MTCRRPVSATSRRRTDRCRRRRVPHRIPGRKRLRRPDTARPPRTERASSTRASRPAQPPTARTPTAHASTTRSTPCECSLLLEGVLHLFAGILEAGLRLVRPALVLGVVVSGGLADGFFGPAPEVLDLVFHFVFVAHAAVATQQ